MYSNYDNSGKIRVLGSSEAAVAEATSATPPIKPQSQLSDIRHFNGALFCLYADTSICVTLLSAFFRYRISLCYMVAVVILMTLGLP